MQNSQTSTSGGDRGRSRLKYISRASALDIARTAIFNYNFENPQRACLSLEARISLGHCIVDLVLSTELKYALLELAALVELGRADDDAAFPSWTELRKEARRRDKSTDTVAELAAMLDLGLYIHRGLARLDKLTP